METLFYNFILPVLAFITILFIFISYKAIRMSYRQEIHHDDMLSHFDYTKNSIISISDSVLKLDDKIDGIVIPQFEKLYNKLTYEQLKINENQLLLTIKEIGLPQADYLTKDKKAIFAGTTIDDDRKISIIFRLKNNNKILQIDTFCYWINSPSKHIMEDLLTFNQYSSIAKVSLEKLREKYVIILSNSIIMPDNCINIDELKVLLGILLTKYSELNAYFKKNSIIGHDILIGDYIKLLIDSSKNYTKKLKLKKNKTSNSKDKLSRKK